MNNKIYIGIDFSINSPGLCIYKEETKQFYFTSFSNMDISDFDKKKVPKKSIIHKYLVDDESIFLVDYKRHKTDKDYIKDQKNKMEDADMLAKGISKYIAKICNNSFDNVYIAMEGFSYASKGNSFIDLIMFNSILRNHLVNLYGNKGAENIYIFSPSAIKGFAGKGNANKLLMYYYWIHNTLNDKDIINNKFFKWCNKSFNENVFKKADTLKHPKDWSEDDFSDKGKEKGTTKKLWNGVEVLKPIDDLVDAYFIVKCLIGSLNII